MTAVSGPDRAWLDQLDALRQAGSQGRWFWNTYSAISSETVARIYNEAEDKLTDDSPDEDWDALPELWIANVPSVTHGDLGTKQGQADAELIVAAVNALPSLLAAARERDALCAAVEGLAEEAERQGERSSFRDFAGNSWPQSITPAQIRAVVADATGEA